MRVYLLRWALTDGIIEVSEEEFERLDFEIKDDGTLLLATDCDGRDVYTLTPDLYALTLDEVREKVAALCARKIRGMQRRIKGFENIAARETPRLKPWAKRRNARFIDDGSLDVGGGDGSVF